MRLSPTWQEEDDWLCTVEFLPGNDPQGRLFGADIVGYLVGYAQLTNTRVLAQDKPSPWSQGPARESVFKIAKDLAAHGFNVLIGSHNLESTCITVKAACPGLPRRT